LIFIDHSNSSQMTLDESYLEALYFIHPTIKPHLEVIEKVSNSITFLVYFLN